MSFTEESTIEHDGIDLGTSGLFRLKTLFEEVGLLLSVVQPHSDSAIDFSYTE